MIPVTFLSPQGEARTIAADDGLSLMEAARRANVAGIVAECGGACACATCHVWVAPDWWAAVGEADAMERDMLEFASGVQPLSRLSCQIRMTPALAGLTVTLPSQD